VYTNGHEYTESYTLDIRSLEQVLFNSNKVC